MPVKYRVQLKAIVNTAASKTALINIPCGQRFHYIQLEHGYASGTNTIAAAMTNIKEIRIMKDSVVQRVMSGTQLRDANLLNGTAYDCTGLPNTAPGVCIPIYFREPWRETPQDQDALAWATAGWETFQIEVDLDSASTPTLTAFAIVDDFVPPANSTPGIVKWLRPVFTAAGTSFQVTTLDRKDFLQSISLYTDSGNSAAFTQVKFTRNGVLLHELTAAANTALLNQFLMTPGASGRTSGMYDLVFDHDGLLDSSVDMSQSRDHILEVTAATMNGTVSALVQRFGVPN